MLYVYLFHKNFDFLNFSKKKKLLMDFIMINVQQEMHTYFF